MIVDIHSHAWRYPDHFSDDFYNQAQAARGGIEIDLAVDYEAYRKRAVEEMVTVVFGGKARRSGLWVDDTFIAQYVKQDDDRLIGFLSVDPTQHGWEDELRYGHQKLGLRVEIRQPDRTQPEYCATGDLSIVSSGR